MMTDTKGLHSTNLKDISRGMQPGDSTPLTARTRRCSSSFSTVSGTSSLSRTAKSSIISRHPSRDFAERFYEVSRVLGEGSFGRVNLVKDSLTGRLRVRKEVNTSTMSSEVADTMREEVELLRTLDHPCIVRLHEFSDDPALTHLTLILEYIQGGDCLALLKQALSARKLLGEGLVAKLTSQVLLALSYCHRRGIVHRDVKPENVMLMHRMEEHYTGPIRCKLIDFGLATLQANAGVELTGTPPYLPPEVVGLKSEYSPRADVWSVGCVAYELLVGVPPFGRPADTTKEETDKVLQRIKRYRGFRDVMPNLEKYCHGCYTRTREALDFLNALLQPEAWQRPEACRAASHVWLEVNRAPHSLLTGDMLQSMSRFARAPFMLRCCLFVAALDIETDCQEEFSPIFLGLDVDGDGIVSQQDLALCLSKSAEWLGVKVDPTTYFNAADLDGSSSLGFTEFIASCLYDRFFRNGRQEELFDRAFHALDRDRDGYLSRLDFPDFFANLPLELQGPRSFSLEEWRTAMTQACGHVNVDVKMLHMRTGLLEYSCDQDLSPCRYKRPGSAPEKPCGAFDFLSSFFTFGDCRRFEGHPGPGELVVTPEEHGLKKPPAFTKARDPAVDIETSPFYEAYSPVSATIFQPPKAPPKAPHPELKSAGAAQGKTPVPRRSSHSKGLGMSFDNLSSPAYVPLSR
eukprot:TRINITY_DN32243_c0_g1_i1.p1 TRINITY_DN32243_c0_g1~~TRINITY_DN32243_c0_g1_i1.p1  ORF type:complete len:688 (-),score=96.48 TRINITY_DN32243_c0_g1_i1:168-2231(-)